MSFDLHSLWSNDARLFFFICWILLGLGVYFLITTIIYFCCSSWYDPNLPNPTHSKQYKYFIRAHTCRVLFLVVGVVDMIFEQLADEVTTYHGVPQRVLRTSISCTLSAGVRTALLIIALYFYAMFCWYKVAIVTETSTLTQVAKSLKKQIKRANHHSSRSPLRPHNKTAIKRGSPQYRVIVESSPYNNPNYNKSYNNSYNSYNNYTYQSTNNKHDSTYSASSASGRTRLMCVQCDHMWRDLLFWYIQVAFVGSLITSLVFISPHRDFDPSRSIGGSCNHNTPVWCLVGYVCLISFEFVALLVIFIYPLYLLYSKKKYLFWHSGGTLSTPAANESKNSRNIRSSPQTNVLGSTRNKKRNNDETFLDRLKSTIVRNAVAGIASIMAFLAFITIFWLGQSTTYTRIWTQGFGYNVAYAHYILNYLCLTYSYHHWPCMIFPVLCKPPWERKSRRKQGKANTSDLHPHTSKMSKQSSYLANSEVNSSDRKGTGRTARNASKGFKSIKSVKSANNAPYGRYSQYQRYQPYTNATAGVTGATAAAAAAAAAGGRASSPHHIGSYSMPSDKLLTREQFESLMDVPRGKLEARYEAYLHSYSNALLSCPSRGTGTNARDLPEGPEDSLVINDDGSVSHSEYTTSQTMSKTQTHTQTMSRNHTHTQSQTHTRTQTNTKTGTDMTGTGGTRGTGGTGSRKSRETTRYAEDRYYEESEGRKSVENANANENEAEEENKKRGSKMAKWFGYGSNKKKNKNKSMRRSKGKISGDMAGSVYESMTSSNVLNIDDVVGDWDPSQDVGNAGDVNNVANRARGGDERKMNMDFDGFGLDLDDNENGRELELSETSDMPINDVSTTSHLDTIHV